MDGEQMVKYLEILKTFIPAFFIDAEGLDEHTEMIDFGKIDFRTKNLTKQALAQKLGLANSFFSF